MFRVKKTSFNKNSPQWERRKSRTHCRDVLGNSQSSFHILPNHLSSFGLSSSLHAPFDMPVSLFSLEHCLKSIEKMKKINCTFVSFNKFVSQVKWEESHFRLSKTIEILFLQLIKEGNIIDMLE